MSWVENVASSTRFILQNCGMAAPLVPALLAMLVVLLLKNVRRDLESKIVFWMFIGVIGAWAFLIPWSILWIAVKGVNYSGPWWAVVPNYAAGLLWPVLAYQLIVRMKSARVPAVAYVICNAPGWLYCFLVAGMAVGGDWV